MDRKKVMRVSLLVALALVCGSVSLWRMVTPSSRVEEASLQTAAATVEPVSVIRSPTTQARRGLRSAKLDTRLNVLATAAEQGMAQALDVATQQGAQVVGERIQVHVVVRPPSRVQVTGIIEALGGTVTGALELDFPRRETLLQAWVPMGMVTALASNVDVDLVRVPDELELLELPLAGAITIEALDDMNVGAWHTLGYRGAGVKVAVIDGGFVGYNNLLGSELPAVVTVKNFVDGQEEEDVNGTTVHGTACAEIIHDIAPEAEMYLVKIATNVDLGEAVAWAVDTVGVDIISTSLGWYGLTPGDGTGQFSDLVSRARAAGILWATAAGNDRLAHWGGQFNDTNGSGYHNFIQTNEINYVDQTVGSGRAFVVYARWDDWTYVTQDYDLTLWGYSETDHRWERIGGSYDTQDGSPGQRPSEYAYAITTGEYLFYGFALSRYKADRNVNFEVFTPRMYPLIYNVEARSLANLGDAPDAFTVAAVDVDSPYTFEFYSAEGPTNGAGGTATGGSIKPDIAAYANVSTYSFGTGGFNGTSAATPHVAGVAALVREAYPAYTVDQVQTYLESQAIDMGTTGIDTQFGYGRLCLGTPPSLSTPVFAPLPTWLFEMGQSTILPLDLWSYASDAQYTVEQLTFTIVNTPVAGAGVNLRDNRYLTLSPLPGWQGTTEIVVRATNPAGRWGEAVSRVVVAERIYEAYLPLVMRVR
ncbi:MAG: S8 family serine peptidase [Anaerolineae bacterium]|nr:S8 family serine peptidase [Anaerolineae bacterium]